MKRLCVYSGSNLGLRPEYKNMTKQLGNLFIKNNLELVYGGSSVGLMGEIANTILENNGKVTGVIPVSLFPDKVINSKLTKLIEVKDMHERKKTMADLSDGFIAIPGGVGTFEELFEVFSWAQLGIHQKPIGILNIANYFDPFIDLVNSIASEGFMKPSNKELLTISDDPESLIKKMLHYHPPVLEYKWEKLEAFNEMK
ncbi:TIGR00730 family Rossman fold protein [Eubacteriaceae bacterium ES2]|nr:TIGR00730 family Rossman fold protein [Eubacteriaceae bacterium ES2]